MLGDLNNKLTELSRSLVGLHVKDVLNKNTKDNNNSKLRSLSDEEKEQLRKIFNDLQDQVNSFVKQTKQETEDTEAADNNAGRTRTTLRDLMQKKKNQEK